MSAAKPFVLYGSEYSYFTGKARPAFRIKRLLTEERLPTPAAYADMLARTGHSFLPTVITPEGETWQDTSDILERLEARQPDPPLFPDTPVQRMAAYLLELYADEFLLLPGLHYRWSFPESAEGARRDFADSSGQSQGAHRFADLVQRTFAPMVGVRPETVPALEAHWYLDVVPRRLLRETSPYAAWMLQRVGAAYRALDETDRARVASALDASGCQPLLDRTPRHRLGKSGFELTWRNA